VQCQPIPFIPSGSAASIHTPTSASEKPSLADLQATIERLEQELVATHRLAMLGTMSAMVTHEINNLVTPIMARADFALSTGMPADMRKALERSRVQAQQVVLVMDRLLNLAKPDQRPMERCAVADGVREAIETATRPFEKDGIQLSLAVPDNLHVRAHAGLFVQTLLNLLLNARQAVKGVRGRLSVAAQRDGDYIVIDVSDNGPGIPHERLQSVINPFLESANLDAPRAWQAVGLGLNVCRTIAQMHGAAIEALAKEGGGCTFRLRWPGA
jgi:signal transduction histidine kinase